MKGFGCGEVSDVVVCSGFDFELFGSLSFISLNDETTFQNIKAILTLMHFHVQILTRQSLVNCLQRHSIQYFNVHPMYPVHYSLQQYTYILTTAKIARG